MCNQEGTKNIGKVTNPASRSEGSKFACSGDFIREIVNYGVELPTMALTIIHSTILHQPLLGICLQSGRDHSRDCQLSSRVFNHGSLPFFIEDYSLSTTATKLAIPSRMAVFSSIGGGRIRPTESERDAAASTTSRAVMSISFARAM